MDIGVSGLVLGTSTVSGAFEGLAMAGVGAVRRLILSTVSPPHGLFSGSFRGDAAFGGGAGAARAGGIGEDPVKGRGAAWTIDLGGGGGAPLEAVGLPGGRTPACRSKCGLSSIIPACTSRINQPYSLKTKKDKQQIIVVCTASVLFDHNLVWRWRCNPTKCQVQL